MFVCLHVCVSCVYVCDILITMHVLTSIQLLNIYFSPAVVGLHVCACVCVCTHFTIIVCVRVYTFYYNCVCVCVCPHLTIIVCACACVHVLLYLRVHVFIILVSTRSPHKNTKPTKIQRSEDI
jgi:hypothetical protein